MASNWRTIDEVTLSYCKSVALLIKERHAELLSQSCGGLQQKIQPNQEEKTTKAPSPTGVVNEEEVANEDDEEEENEEENEERRPDRTPQFSDVLMLMPNVPAAVSPSSSAPAIFHENAVHQDYWNGTTHDSDVSLGEQLSEQSAHDDGVVQHENCHDLLLHQSMNDPLPLEQVVHNWWVKYGDDENLEDFFAVDILD